jgi:chemotaxis response regulator CheB
MVPDEQTPESVMEPAASQEAGKVHETEPLFPVVAIGASAGGLDAFHYASAASPYRFRHGVCFHPAPRSQSRKHAAAFALERNGDAR